MVTSLISTSAAARVLVPSNGTLGLTWTARSFNDTAWRVTNTPVGFAVGLRATSTGPGGTSEDSPDLVVMPPGPYGNSDLGIMKTDSADPVIVGTNFTYTITVTNRGPLAATNIIARDFIPSLLFVIFPPPLTTTHGQFLGGNPLSVYIPKLTNGETATITFTCNSFVFTNVFSNAVTVTSAMTDPNPANNSDFELTTVIPFALRPSLTIALENGLVVVRWTGNSMLQSAPDPLGPWTDLPTATSPLQVSPAQTTQRCYRLRGP